MPIYIHVNTHAKAYIHTYVRMCVYIRINNSFEVVCEFPHFQIIA